MVCRGLLANEACSNVDSASPDDQVLPEPGGQAGPCRGHRSRYRGYQKHVSGQVSECASDVEAGTPVPDVSAHGLALSFAALFQQAGYAAFAFDYSGFGASRGIFPRQRLDFYAQQRDWDDVLSYVRKHELVGQ